ncbi:MAG: Rv2993c-like domain-containing protein [Pseudomonadota bacterium]
MRLVTFSGNGSTRTGVLRGETVIDLSASDHAIPTDMVDLLRGGYAMMERVAAAAASGAFTLPLAEVHLECPVLRPRKILAVGLNPARCLISSGTSSKWSM